MEEEENRIVELGERDSHDDREEKSVEIMRMDKKKKQQQHKMGEEEGHHDLGIIKEFAIIEEKDNSIDKSSHPPPPLSTSILQHQSSLQDESFRHAILKKESFTEDGTLKSPLSVFVELLEKSKWSTSDEEDAPHATIFDSFVIDAAHPLKVWWDFLVVISILWTLIVVPYQLTFNLTPHGWIKIFGLVIDSIFVIDTLLSFFTSYYDGSEQITSFYMISLRYLKTWFLPDIISVFPFEYIFTSPGVSSLGLVRIFRLFRLIKIIRIARLQNKIINASATGHLSKTFTSLSTMIFVVFFVCHLYACGFHQFSHCVPGHLEPFEDDIIVKAPSQHAAQFYLDYLDCKHQDNLFSLYVIALYWTFASLLTVGYGDLVLTSSFGRLYTLLVVFTGNILFGYLIAIMLEQTLESNPLLVKNRQDISRIHKYLQRRHITPSITKRILRHFEYYYPRRALLIEPEDTIQSCPIYLRKELFSILNSKIYSLNLLAADINLIFELVPFFHPYLMESNEILLAEGDYCSELYFVVNGIINGYVQNVHTNNKKIYVGIWTSGSDFNISCVTNLRKNSWATYKSYKRTELLWFDRLHLIRYKDIAHEAKNTNATSLIWKIFHTRGEGEFDHQESIAKEMKGKSIFKLGIVDHHLPRMIFNNKVVDTNEFDVKGYLPFQHVNKLVASRFSVRNLRSLNSIGTRSNGSIEDLDSSSHSSGAGTKTVAVKYFHVTRPTGIIVDGIEEMIHLQETSWMMLQRGIINPQSSPKIYFDLFVIFCTLLLLVTIPLRIGFSLPLSPFWKIYDQAIQYIFIVDCICSFFTAFERSDYTLNTEHKDIVLKYLQSWFLIDFLSAFPFEILFTQHGLSVLKLLKLLRIVRMTRLFKVLKISRILKVFKFSSTHISRHDVGFSFFEDVTLRLLRGIAVVGYVVHVLCCGWYFITLHTGKDGDHDIGQYSWYNPDPTIRPDTVSPNLISLYVGSLYYVSATSSSVGYGDLIAITDTERMYAILIMIVGTVVVSFVVAQVVHTESFSHQASSKSSYQDIETIRHYLTEQGISKTLTHSVLKHYLHFSETRTEFDEQDIWNRTPLKYRLLLATHSYQKIINQFHSLFNRSETSIITAILTYLQPCYSLSGNYIYDYETGCDGYYLLHNGAVEIIDEDKTGSEIILGNIHPGKIFGETSLFISPSSDTMKCEPEIITSSSELTFLGVRALVNCQIYHLSLAHVVLFKTHHPLIAPDILHHLQLQSKLTMDTATSEYAAIRNKIKIKLFQGTTSRSSSIASYTSSFPLCSSLSILGILYWFFGDFDDDYTIIRSNYLNSAHETMKSYTEKEIEALLNALKNKSPSMILSSNGREKYLAMKKLIELRRAQSDRSSRKKSYTSVTPLQVDQDKTTAAAGEKSISMRDKGGIGIIENIEENQVHVSNHNNNNNSNSNSVINV